MAKKFLSIKDFCKETGISRALFYTMRKNGDAPAMFNAGNKRVLISREAMEEWVKNRHSLFSERVGKRGRGAEKKLKQAKTNLFTPSNDDVFLVIPRYLVQNPAYADLSGSAAKLLLALISKRDQNNIVSFGYRNGAEFGLSINTTKRALIDLADKGFITKAASAMSCVEPSKWILNFDVFTAKTVAKSRMSF